MNGKKLFIMLNKKTKLEEVARKLLLGAKIARKKMLIEKSLKGEYVIYSENGKIKRESAKKILEREKEKK